MIQALDLQRSETKERRKGDYKELGNKPCQPKSKKENEGNHSKFKKDVKLACLVTLGIKHPLC